MQLDVADRLLCQGKAYTGIDKATETASKSLREWEKVVRELHYKIDYSTPINDYEMGIIDAIQTVKKHIGWIESEGENGNNT